MGDKGGGKWRLRFVDSISRRNLTDTVAPFPKGISRKGNPGLNMSLYRKKNVLLRKFWKDGEKGVSDKDLCSLILCCITVIV